MSSRWVSLSPLTQFLSLLHLHWSYCRLARRLLDRPQLPREQSQLLAAVLRALSVPFPALSHPDRRPAPPDHACHARARRLRLHAAAAAGGRRGLFAGRPSRRRRRLALASSHKQESEDDASLQLLAPRALGEPAPFSYAHQHDPLFDCLLSPAVGAMNVFHSSAARRYTSFSATSWTSVAAPPCSCQRSCSPSTTSWPRWPLTGPRCRSPRFRSRWRTSRNSTAAGRCSRLRRPSPASRRLWTPVASCSGSCSSS